MPPSRSCVKWTTWDPICEYSTKDFASLFSFVIRGNFAFPPFASFFELPNRAKRRRSKLMVSMSSTSAPDLRLTVGKRASRCRRASSTSNRRLRRRVRGRTKVNASSASKPVTEPNSRRATFTRDDAKNETMQMSALRPKEKNGKASNNAFISVPVTKKSAPSSTNQTTTFLSPQIY